MLHEPDRLTIEAPPAERVEPHARVPSIVLVISDDADIVAKYERILSADGVRVSGSSTAEAFEYAIDFRPDLIILDSDASPPAAVAALLAQIQAEPHFHDVAVLLGAGSPAQPGRDISGPNLASQPGDVVL